MPEDKCPYHDSLQSDVTDIKKTVTRIDKRLSEGGVRIGMLEKVVYSIVGLTLTAVVVGVISLVLRGSS